VNKKGLLIFSALALLTLLLAGCGALSTSFSGSDRNSSSRLTADGWTYTADSVNGRLTTRNLTLTAENLASLHVESRIGSGGASLILMQGDNERTIDISGNFSGYIDTSGFEPGDIRLRLQYDSARNVNVSITW